MKLTRAAFVISLSHVLVAAATSDKFVQLLTPAINDSGKLVFAIATAKEVEILALDPVRIDENQKPSFPTSVSTFHGFAILGTARVTDAKEIQRLAESLGKAIDAGKSSAWCFSPRHALRIKKPDGQIDVVVCFECLAVQVHGLAGYAHAAIAPKLAQTEWEAIFTTHLSEVR